MTNTEVTKQPHIILGLIQCLHCRQLVDEKEFYPNYNKYLKYGKMPFCKKCSKEIVDSIFKECNGFEMGLRNICSLFNIPYLNEAMLKLKEIKDNSLKPREIDYIFQYSKIIRDMDIPKEYWSDLSGNNFTNKRLIKDKDLRCTDEDMNLLQRLEQDWGEQYNTLDEYLMLEEKFYLYSKGESLTPAMITILRYLCSAELDAYKLKKTKAPQKEIETAEKRVSEYYKKLKLDEFKFKNQKTEFEKTLEDFAYVHEKVEPLTWEGENAHLLKDRMGFDKDYDDIMRSMGNKVIGSKDYPKLTFEDVNRERK